MPLYKRERLISRENNANKSKQINTFTDSQILFISPVLQTLESDRERLFALSISCFVEHNAK